MFERTLRRLVPTCAISTAIFFVACGGSGTTVPGGTPASANPAPAVAPSATVLIVVPTAAATVPAAPTPAPADTPTPAPATADDARQLIFDAIDRLDTRGPYKMHITSSQPNTPPAEVQVVPPDKLRITFSNADGTPFETVLIGKTSYNLLDGKWRIDTIEPSAESANPALADTPKLQDIQDIKPLGAKQVNGVNATGFALSDAARPGEANTIWIGPNGGPVQLITVKPDETGTFDVTYDDSIKIEAPVQ